jgi:hypothetical protein
MILNLTPLELPACADGTPNVRLQARAARGASSGKPLFGGMGT